MPADDPRFGHDTYTVRRKFLSFAGAKFHIYGPNDALVLYCKLKAFRLREDIRVYNDESLSQEVIRITTPQILDIGATYDVVDSINGESVGKLRRKGLKSILRDEWLLLDTAGNELGKGAGGLAGAGAGQAVRALRQPRAAPRNTLRPWAGGRWRGSRQNFNPLLIKITLDFSADSGDLLDRRLGHGGGDHALCHRGKTEVIALSVCCYASAGSLRRSRSARGAGGR